MGIDYSCVYRHHVQKDAWLRLATIAEAYPGGLGELFGTCWASTDGCANGGLGHCLCCTCHARG